jgi:hypothetical protein
VYQSWFLPVIARPKAVAIQRAESSALDFSLLWIGSTNCVLQP